MNLFSLIFTYFELIEGDSDDEEGMVANRGKSSVATETVYFHNDDIADDKELNRIMGFTGFDTTKNKPVDDNFHGAAVGGTARHKKRAYRQYMNRKGGFDRPLQKMD